MLSPLAPTEINGQPYSRFYSDKVRALLAYLVLEGEQPVHRKRLAALLWAGYQRRSARANLRRALTELRRLFKPFELLQTTYQTVQLDQTSAAVVCDVLEFRTLLDHCRALPLTAGVEPHSFVKAQRANLLYSREFLPGFKGVDSIPFHAWRAEQALKLAEDHVWLQRWLENV